MWFAIVIITVLNSAGWFLYGISCGEKDTDAIMAKLTNIADTKAYARKVGPNSFE